MSKRKRIEQLENMLLQKDLDIKILKQENKDLKKQIDKHQKSEFLTKELLSIAKKINFKPLEVEHYRPFRHYGNHTEVRDRGTGKDGVPLLEIVVVEDYDEEKRWTETITFEENPREYLDLIRTNYLRSIDVWWKKIILYISYYYLFRYGYAVF